MNDRGSRPGIGRMAGRLAGSGWPAVIVLAGLLAYSNTFNSPFLFDDLPGIVDNPAVTAGQPLRNLLLSQNPLVTLSLRANWLIGQRDVRGYHAFNLAVHILAGLALYGIARRTLLLPSMAPACRGRSARPLAAAVALVWTLHPVQTESVTYIIQRKESLMGLFYLLTFYCFIRGATGEGRVGRGAWQAASVVACTLGMASKQVAATAPLMVLLYDRTFLGGSFGGAIRRRWVVFLLLAAVTGGLFAAGSLGRLLTEGLGTPTVSTWTYASNQFAAVLRYLRLAVVPAGLTFDYGWPMSRTAGQIIPPAIALGVLLGLSLWALWRRPRWGFLAAWWFVALVPSSSIMVVATAVAFERRMYIPLAGVAAGAVMAGFLLWRRAAGRVSAAAPGLGPIGVAVIALVFGALAFARNQDYRSALTIWQDTVAKRPDNARARNNYGHELLAAGRPGEAIAQFDAAIALKPDYAHAYNNRGIACADQGDYHAAIDSYTRAIEAEPHLYQAYNNRAIARAAVGERSEAIADYSAAIWLNPGYYQAYLNRAGLLAESGDHDGAIADYSSAISLDPRATAPYLARGQAFAARGRRGDIDLAIADFDAALRIDRQSPDAIRDRGIAYASKGDHPRAIADLTAAIGLNGRDALAYYNRGAAYLAVNNLNQAIADLTAAIELNPDYADAYERRATAYFLKRDFDRYKADVAAYRRLNPTLQYQPPTQD